MADEPAPAGSLVPGPVRHVVPVGSSRTPGVGARLWGRSVVGVFVAHALSAAAVSDTVAVAGPRPDLAHAYPR